MESSAVSPRASANVDSLDSRTVLRAFRVLLSTCIHHTGSNYVQEVRIQDELATS